MDSMENFLQFVKSKGISFSVDEQISAYRMWEAGRKSMLHEVVRHFEEIGAWKQTYIGDVLVDLKLMKP